MFEVDGVVYTFNDLSNHMELARQWSGAIQAGRNIDLQELRHHTSLMMKVHKAAVNEGRASFHHARRVILMDAYLGRMVALNHAIEVAGAAQRSFRQLQSPGTSEDEIQQGYR